MGMIMVAMGGTAAYHAAVPQAQAAAAQADVAGLTQAVAYVQATSATAVSPAALAQVDPGLHVVDGPVASTATATASVVTQTDGSTVVSVPAGGGRCATATVGAGGGVGVVSVVPATGGECGAA
jgi:hypothetical protein